MTNTKSRVDLTSADTKIIGFDFQYFFFINELLKLENGQSIGFEVKDDVHIELPNNRNARLFQLKHTVQKNTNGAPKNLSDSDLDLWKSLSNWTKVICDKVEGRAKENEQVCYLKNTEFILATNKNLSQNKFISKISDYKSDTKNYSSVISLIDDIKTNSKDETLKIYIQDILGMKVKTQKLFFEKLQFIDTGNDIINSIKKNIQGKMISKERVNDVFNSLFSELKQDFFNKVKKGQRQIITYDEWVKKYTHIFENNRTTRLPLRSFKLVFPSNLFEQPFVQELIEIGEIKKDDLVQVAEFSDFMLRIQMNLEQWHEDGEITADEVDRFHKEALLIWKNIHKKVHRSSKFDLGLDYINSLNCLDEIRTKELKMITTEIGIDLSNGEFYYLSNDKKIGWKLEWEGKY